MTKTPLSVLLKQVNLMHLEENFENMGLYVENLEFKKNVYKDDTDTHLHDVYGVKWSEDVLLVNNRSTTVCTGNN
jgi:hypothetical protein